MTIAASFGLRVEIAFASAADAVTPSWTDVTAYLHFPAGVSISHGRQDEMAQVGTGTSAFVLDNTDGRFTPGNPASPYYPNVKLRRKVRISWRDPNVGTGPYTDRFVGYVDDWDTSHPYGSSLFAACRVSASDRVKRLSAVPGLLSHIEQEFMADHPVAYWPLGDNNPVTPRESIGNYPRVSPMVIRHSGGGGTLAWNGTGPANDGLTAPIFTPASASDGYWLSADSAGFSPSMTATAECAVNTTSATGRILALTYGLWYADVVLSAGYAQVRINYGSPPVAAVTTSTAYLADGNTHHVAISVQAAQTVLYVDGAAVATAVLAQAVNWSQVRAAGDGENGILFGCTIAHIAVYDGLLSAARILEHAKAVLNGCSQDTPGGRIARYAGWVGVPTGELNLAAGDEPAVGPVDTTGKSPWAAMQLVATTEGGVLFVNRSGMLTLTARSARFNTSSAMTLSVASEQVGPGIRPLCNDARVINVAAVSCLGFETVVTDATSVADFGEYRASITTAHVSTVAVQSYAAWLVAKYKDPATRIEDLSIDLQTDSVSLASALALEIGSRITVTGLPSAFPASTMDVIVEGWREDISPDSWDLALSTSPADLTVYWQLGVAGRTELGVTTTLAH